MPARWVKVRVGPQTTQSGLGRALEISLRSLLQRSQERRVRRRRWG